MVLLLRIKDVVSRFADHNKVYIRLVIRFAVALCTFLLIHYAVGFQDALSPAISLFLAIACAFLPSGVMVLIAAVLIVVNFAALSLDLAFIVLLLFAIMFFVYFRFSNGKGIYTMLTPLLSVVRIPYVVPVSLGLLEEPQNVLAVVSGSMAYFIVRNVHNNEALFRSLSSDYGHLSNLTVIWHQLMDDREMYIYLLAFTASAIAVYLIRKTSLRGSREVAVIAGGLVQMLMICVGELVLGDYSSLVWVIIGCIISILISLAVSFLALSVDFTRVERVQFEDDEYYYYVKAVPKMSVTAEEKKIKAISGPDTTEEEETKKEGFLHRRSSKRSSRDPGKDSSSNETKS